MEGNKEENNEKEENDEKEETDKEKINEKDIDFIEKDKLDVENDN